MTKNEMLSELNRILQGNSFGPDLLVADLDEALLDAAAFVKIPALQSSDTIVTVTNDFQADMPARFHHDLYLVEQPDQNYGEIEILLNLRSLARIQQNKHAGRACVRWCCEQNGVFYYHPIPETPQELLVHFYEEPESLAINEEAHTVIPSNLHFQVLVCAVAAKRWAMWEDGIDGQQVNTAYYQQENYKGLSKLALLYPDAPKKPFRPVRRASYF